MCNDVFEMLSFFTNISEKVEFETWSDLLLAHIKIYNHLVQRKLRTNASTVEDKYEQEMGSMLEHQCVRNLFVIWLKSHPSEQFKELWDGLFELLQRYFPEDSAFHFWKITVLNLSRAIIKNIFKVTDEVPVIGNYEVYETTLHECASKGAKGKKPKFNPKQHVVDLDEFFNGIDEETLLHLWHKMINMYGKSNASVDATTHTNKMKVIGEVVDMFLVISHVEIKLIKGQTSPPFIHSPEANRLLELFLEWLLEACDRLDSDFVEGRSIAYSTLCKIVCQKSSQMTKKNFLANFYRSVHIGLNVKLGGTTKTIESIVMHAQRLFSLGLQGSLALIPDFVRAAESILKISSNASQDLRCAAIHVLASVIHPAYYYDGHTLPALPSGNAETEDDLAMLSFRRIRSKICQIILGAIDDARYEEA